MKSLDKEASLQAAEKNRCKTEQRLRRAGLSRTYYMKKLKDLCEATKPVSCVSGKDAGAGSVDFIDVPDNQTQLGAIRTIIDLYGDKAALKQDVKHEGNIEILITNYAGASSPTSKPRKGAGK
mgnify:FL=1